MRSYKFFFIRIFLFLIVHLTYKFYTGVILGLVKKNYKGMKFNLRAAYEKNEKKLLIEHFAVLTSIPHKSKVLAIE